ncbi:MAG: hypothetical protein ACI9J3_003175 [Parvicellaceae bacterium]|jgi:hypothetical protein
MKLTLRHLPALVLLFIATNLISQQSSEHIMLNTGSIQLENNVQDYKLSSSSKEICQGRVYRLIQLNNLPSEAAHELFKSKGIKLLEYIPNKAYVASIPLGVLNSELASLDIRSVVRLPAEMKQLRRIVERPFPNWSLENGKVKVVIKIQEGLSTQYGISRLGEMIKLNSIVSHANLVYANIDEDDLLEIAKMPYVRYVDLAPEIGEPEHDHGRTLHRGNMLDQDLGIGRQYDGTGVTIAINDDGFVGPHIDFTGRTDQTDVAGDFAGDHGDMVAGIAGGAGNLDPTMRGMAPGSFLFIRQYNSALPNTVTLHQNDQVMIFNASYSNGCNAGYTSLTEQVDDEIFDNPSLLQVFSAGNSGGNDCGYGAGSAFGNVTGGHKIAKNVIATANLNESDALENSSSRGPSADGRLKPDISAHGAGQMSTDPNNGYAAGGGTSAAAPGIAGMTALLYHAYKDLNGGTNPNSGLIKACMLNSADDLGNVGPDYSFGWGRINGYKAVTTLEDSRYLLDSVSNGSTNSHSVTIPAGVQELRVMLYWMESSGSPSSSIILINDLDLTIDDPSVTTFQPLVLDPTPIFANLSATAVPGRDSLNNAEQVRITTPAAGTYSVNVDGFAIPFGNQKYYIVWEYIMDDITVTYPFGEEGFVPGEVELIRWDAYGNSGTFDVEYSLDNGSTWTFVAAGVSGTLRERAWSVPTGPSERALVRVTRGAVSDMSDDNFIIAETPANITLDWVCVDSLQISWDLVPGATEYEVSMLGAMYMDSVGRTTADTMILYGHDYNVEDWFSVTPILALGGEGRRANAVQKVPGITNCPLSYSLEVTEMLSPVSGTMFGCHASSTVPVMVLVTNAGLSPIFDIPVNFSLNGGAVVTETILDTLLPGQDTLYTFLATVDLSSNGLYQLISYTDHPLDQFLGDDTISLATTVATGLTLSGIWTEDFEGFSLCGSSNDCGATICNTGPGWKNESSSTIDDNDWRTDLDGTPSAGTGPSADHTLGTSTGQYMFTEASGGCTDMEALLLTPCIDLAAMGAPELSFWYHMDGGDMGTLSIDIFNGVTYDNDVWSVSGDLGASWIEGTYDLSAYAGQIINVRFRGTTGGDYQSDMALDDIGVSTPFSVDESTSANWSVWPNPSADQFNVQFSGFESGTSALLYDILGKVVANKSLNGASGTVEFDVSNLDEGTYIIVFNSNGKQVGAKQVVVMH